MGEADAAVAEVGLGEVGGEVDVAAVHYEVAAHGAGHDWPGGEAELLPLGEEHEGVGIKGGSIHVGGVGNGVAKATAALIHGHGIEGGEIGRAHV